MLAITTSETLPKKDGEPFKKNQRSRNVLLALLFIGVLVLALLAAYKKNSTPLAIMPAPTASKKNEQLTKLIAQLNDSTKTVVMPSKGTVLEITAPMMISKDSFYLKGNGSVITADSLYKGPAFIINSSAKHIVLDSLVFKNFDVGLILQKNNVVVKSVRFINCRIPVQYSILFADSLVSGKFKDSIFVTYLNLK